MRKALVTGIGGQDGAYLAKHLVELGYEVYGAVRRSSRPSTSRLEWLGIEGDVTLVPFELADISNITRVIREIKPAELYNLGAQTYVGVSWQQPLTTCDVNAQGVLRILEAIRDYSPDTRFYQASTSEMFGRVREVPQSETTPFYPRSPYGVSKAFSHWITVNYRESFGLHASSGILFNHESPLRGHEFVTRKITRGLARIKAGKQALLELGNLDSKRDWGFAGDYVRGMWQMLQETEPDDYVLASGEAHTVREFVQLAASNLGFELEWTGSGIEERAIDRRTGNSIVVVNEQFYRPAEVDTLLGDPSKAQRRLGWTCDIAFEQLVAMMSEADLKRETELTTPAI